MTQQEFIKFYNQWVEKIYRFIFLKVNSRETAQDLTSEAFLKMLGALKNDQKIENPQAFLYQIARNLVTDHYREKARQPLPLEESFPILEREKQPDIQLAQASQMEEVRRALGQIKEEYADIVAWHYLDDLAIPEIARMTGRPEGTIRVMLHRGLEQIKHELEQIQHGKHR